jgi:putative transposase
MSLVSVAPGAVLRHGEVRVRVIVALAADRLLVEPCDSERAAYAVSIGDLKPDAPTLAVQLKGIDLSRVPAAEWERVSRLAKCLWELHEAPHLHRTRVAAAAAKELGLHSSRVWHWYASFVASGFKATALLRKKRGPDAGLAHIDRTDTIISEELNRRYQTQERRPLAAIVLRIRDLCRKARAHVPSISTVYRRARDLNVREKTKRRLSAAAARKKFKALPGAVPKGDGPLALVLIDHTQLKVNAVDAEHREVIGAPWITIAIDAYSRAIYGFHVSMHRPNATSVALCMAHGLLPKDAYLKRLGIKGRWPVYGPMKKLSFDGGKEFKSPGFLRGCAIHGVWEAKARFPGRPHFGALIERYIGTLMDALRTLPGRTFRNIEDRKHYKSDKKACMTLEEIELWIATYIVQVYHCRIHGGTGEPPIVRYEAGMLARGELPPIPEDPERVRLDFLPRKRCAVTTRGIRWDYRWYWGDILQSFIDKGLPQSVWARRDDRNWGVAYIELPDGAYSQVETNSDRSSGRDAQRRSRAYLKAVGQDVYEQQLVRADEELERQEREAARRTKSARRRTDTRRHDATAPKYSQPGRKSRGPEVRLTVPAASRRRPNPFPNIDGE